MAFSLESGPPLSIAVIGSGITGLSAAWLLSRGGHAVTLFEKDARIGGHANTVRAEIGGRPVPIDTGFIVYNELNYPNFTALLRELSVETHESDMSFAVSLRDRGVEYSSNNTSAFLNGGRNLANPRFWRMALDLVRFYRGVAADEAVNTSITLGAYLDAEGYSEAFQRDHILPMAAAIWSSCLEDMRAYPLGAFVRFFVNHGLLLFSGRPAWRSVIGGSRAYVSALRGASKAQEQAGTGVASVTPVHGGVEIRETGGNARVFDRVLIATHTDQALALLPNADAEQRALLGAIPYRANSAILHTDPSFMPRRRQTWSSWNYVGDNTSGGCALTYWMNRLQQLQTSTPVFVTLNAERRPNEQSILWEGDYDHPCFSPEAMRAQCDIWRVQGREGVWFAGAWMGAGFHEDGLQAGLAAAEAIGGVRRPWIVPDESARLSLPTATSIKPIAEAA